jgi:hypothetical protein
MGLWDELIKDLKENALDKWDYSGIFPITNPDGTLYTNQKGPVILEAFNWQLDGQLQQLRNKGQLQQPVISIDTLYSDGENYTFGNVVSESPPTRVLGRRIRAGFLVACWADQQLGGLPFARKLAGQVYGCLTFYANSLRSIRHLELRRSHDGYESSAQLYHDNLVLEGDAFMRVQYP